MRNVMRVAVLVVVGSGCVVAMEPPANGDGLGLACSEGLDELRVCAEGATVHGVDVSYWQGRVDWSTVSAAGHVFGFARISDGLRYVDTQFANNWQGMAEQGMVRGAYQFFRSNLDPVQQADLVIAKIEAAGGLADDDLGVVLDLESTDGMSAATVVARAKVWLQRVEEATGRRPMVYTAAFMSSVIGNNFRDYPLWVANYGATCPVMPSGWSQWAIWQYSDSGRIPGLTGNFDVNVFNGDEDALRAFARSLKRGASADTGTTEPPPPAGPAYCLEAVSTGLNGGRLNIRPQPNTSRSPVGTLAEGRQVPILDRTDGEQIGSTTRWLKIRSPAGVTGWVSGRYLRCVGTGVLDTGDGTSQPDDTALGFGEGRGMGQGDGAPGPSSEVVPAAPCGWR
ncbi:MAG: SH3 domain-containing protein [Deltaproteobacteria bacterium]|nr:SH3 domain-containing protein [Deltaproteobacteria bacterium]